MRRGAYVLALAVAACLPLAYTFARHLHALPDGMQWSVVGTSLVLAILFTLAFAPPREASFSAWMRLLRERLDGPADTVPAPAAPLPPPFEAPAVDVEFTPAPPPRPRSPSGPRVFVGADATVVVSDAAYRPELERPPPFEPTAPLLPQAEPSTADVPLPTVRLLPEPPAPPTLASLPVVTAVEPVALDDAEPRTVPYRVHPVPPPPAIPPVRISEVLPQHKAAVPHRPYQAAYEEEEGRAATRAVLPAPPKKPSQ